MNKTASVPVFQIGIYPNTSLIRYTNIRFYLHNLYTLFTMNQQQQSIEYPISKTSLIKTL